MGDRRYWPRPEEDRHILGEIRCVMVGETRVQALMLYESSVGRGCEPPGAVRLRGKVIGSMDAIQCTICNRVHDWIIGQDAIDELLSRTCHNLKTAHDGSRHPGDRESQKSKTLSR